MTTDPKHSGARTVIAAAALAASALLVASGVADAAESEEQIKNDCSSQVGGTYTTSVGADGVRTSKCCYEGLFGVTHCDVYLDGEWNGGLSSNEQPTKSGVPGLPPAVPPGELSPDQQNPAPPKGPIAPPLTTVPQRQG